MTSNQFSPEYDPPGTSDPIIIRYRACDGYKETRRYQTLEGARKYAHNMIGPHPDMGCDYAVSEDGIGTIRVSGASLREIFPESVS